jgi:hypothetical protein
MPFCSDSPRIASRDATVNLSDTVGTPSITVTQEEVPLTEATISPPSPRTHSSTEAEADHSFTRELGIVGWDELEPVLMAIPFSGLFPINLGVPMNPGWDSFWARCSLAAIDCVVVYIGVKNH